MASNPIQKSIGA
jgi:hypothetical protein